MLERQNTVKSTQSVKKKVSVTSSSSKKNSTNGNAPKLQEMERQISTFNDYETFVDETSADYSSELFNKQEIAELEQKNKSLVGGIMSMR